MASMWPDAVDQASVARGTGSSSSAAGRAGGKAGAAAPATADKVNTAGPEGRVADSDEVDGLEAVAASFDDGDDLLAGVEDAPAPGVVLIEPGLLCREVGCRYVDDELVEATSAEDEQRRRYLRRYADAPGGLFRRYLIADAGTLARLAALRAEAPNAARLIDIVERACLLSRHAGSPLQLPPVLLLGPPGTGKTRVARRIAEVIGTMLTVIDGGSTTDRGPIVGHDPGYRGSTPGRVAAALLEGPTTGPLMLLDELDKVSAYSPGVRPLDALLPLLEPSTARSFTDTYLGLPMRADGVLWIGTANSVAGLPAPVLDRVVVVEMPPLGRAETRQGIARIFAELLSEHGLPAADLGTAALMRLERSGLRAARRVLALALGPALTAGRGAPDAADIATVTALVGRPANKPSRTAGRPAASRPPRPAVGFVHFTRPAAVAGKGPAASRPG